MDIVRLLQEHLRQNIMPCRHVNRPTDTPRRRVVHARLSVTVVVQRWRRGPSERASCGHGTARVTTSLTRRATSLATDWASEFMASEYPSCPDGTERVLAMAQGGTRLAKCEI